MSTPAWMTAPVWQGFKWSPSDTAAHSGIDLGMPVGTPITAPMDGEIISSGNEPWGGQVNELVTIGGRQYVLTWIHLSQVEARPGHVVRGQEIGRSGTPPPGYGSGAHTHFEVTTGSTPPYMGYNPWRPSGSTHPVNAAPFLAMFKVGSALNGLGLNPSVPGTGGISSGPGGSPKASGGNGNCRHQVSLFPGNTTCLDPALDGLNRAGLLFGAAILVVMALAIWAHGNANVRAATDQVAGKALKAATLA